MSAPMIIRSRKRRGAVVVEATLTLLLFLTFLFSLFDFGFALYFRHTLMHQARMAARYGCVVDTSVAANITKIQNVFLYGDPDNTAGLTTGVLGLDPSKVDVAVQPAPTGQPAARLVVTVSNFQFPLITMWFAGLRTGRTITVNLPIEM